MGGGGGCSPPPPPPPPLSRGREPSNDYTRRAETKDLKYTW